MFFSRSPASQEEVVEEVVEETARPTGSPVYSDFSDNSIDDVAESDDPKVRNFKAI